MRWPWSTPAGKVRVSHADLIELQRGALQALELEQEIRVARGNAARAEATAALAELQGLPLSVREAALSDLPLTAEGHLHVRAFHGLVEGEMWAERERMLADMLADLGPMSVELESGDDL